MHNYEPWQINPKDYPSSDHLESRIGFIARYGLLAASVHNTQPWKFRLKAEVLEIVIDSHSALHKGDATKRETWISLGACSENILIAARAFGLEASISKVGSDYLELHFHDAERKPVNIQLLETITNRRTDRSMFTDKAIDKELIAEIQASWNSENIEIVITQDRDLINKVAELTGASIKMALSLPEFRRELSSLMRTNWTKKPDGMPGFVLGKGSLASVVNPILLRYFNLGAVEAKRDAALIRSASAMALVLSSGEGSKFWVEAGRAYEHIAIETTKQGISNGTFAATVEAPEVHKEIEAVLKTNYRLQAVMRLGYSNSKPTKHSPRKSLDQVLITSS